MMAGVAFRLPGCISGVVPVKSMCPGAMLTRIANPSSRRSSAAAVGSDPSSERLERRRMPAILAVTCSVGNCLIAETPRRLAATLGTQIGEIVAEIAGWMGAGLEHFCNRFEIGGCPL